MCIRSSLAEARLQPGEVQIGECHGTGTALGDPIEIGAMKSVQLPGAFGKKKVEQ